MSPEASYISMFSFAGGFIGALYGGLLESRIANLNYRESNEAVVYYSQKAAQRDLLDKTTIGFGKGVARWGSRYFVFCFSLLYVVLMHTISITNRKRATVELLLKYFQWIEYGIGTISR